MDIKLSSLSSQDILFMQDVLDNNGEQLQKEEIIQQNKEDLSKLIEKHVLGQNPNFNGNVNYGNADILLTELVSRCTTSMQQEKIEDLEFFLEIILKIKEKYELDKIFHGIQKQIKYIFNFSQPQEFLIQLEALNKFLKKTCNSNIKLCVKILIIFLLEKEEFQDFQSELFENLSQKNKPVINLNSDYVITIVETKQFNLTSFIKKEQLLLFDSHSNDPQQLLLQSIFLLLLQFVNQDFKVNENFLDFTLILDQIEDPFLIKRIFRSIKSHFTQNLLPNYNFQNFEELLLQINQKNNTIQQLSKILLKIQGFTLFTNFFANYDSLIIFPDFKADFFGDWKTSMLKQKECRRYNMYITERKKLDEKNEKIKGYIIDRNGKSDFEGKIGTQEFDWNEVQSMLPEGLFPPDVRIADMPDDQKREILANLGMVDLIESSFAIHDELVIQFKITNYNGDLNQKQLKAKFYDNQAFAIGTYQLEEGIYQEKIEFWCNNFKKKPFVFKVNKPFSLIGIASAIRTDDQRTKYRYKGFFGLTDFKVQKQNIDGETVFSGSHYEDEKKGKFRYARKNNESIRFDIDFGEGMSKYFERWEGKRISKSIYEGQICGCEKNKPFSPFHNKFFLYRPRQGYEKDMEIQKLVFESQFWKLINRINDSFKILIKEKYFWFGSSDFLKNIKNVSQSQGESIVVLNQFVDIMTLLPFDNYDISFSHYLKNLMIEHVQNEFKSLAINPKDVKYLLSSLIKYLEQQMVWNYQWKMSIKEDLEQFLFTKGFYEEIKKFVESKDQPTKVATSLLPHVNHIFGMITSTDTNYSLQSHTSEYLKDKYAENQKTFYNYIRILQEKKNIRYLICDNFKFFYLKGGIRHILDTQFSQGKPLSFGDNKLVDHFTTSLATINIQELEPLDKLVPIPNQKGFPEFLKFLQPKLKEKFKIFLETIIKNFKIQKGLQKLIPLTLLHIYSKNKLNMINEYINRNFIEKQTQVESEISLMNKIFCLELPMLYSKAEKNSKCDWNISEQLVVLTEQLKQLFDSIILICPKKPLQEINSAATLKEKLYLIDRYKENYEDLTDFIKCQQFLAQITVIFPTIQNLPEPNTNQLSLLVKMYKLLLDSYQLALHSYSSQSEVTFVTNSTIQLIDEDMIEIENVDIIYWIQQLIKKFQTYVVVINETYLFKDKAIQQNQPVFDEFFIENHNFRVEVCAIINNYPTTNLTIQSVSQYFFLLHHLVTILPQDKIFYEFKYGPKEINLKMLEQMTTMFSFLRTNKDKELFKLKEIISSLSSKFTDIILLMLKIQVIHYQYGSDEFSETFRKDPKEKSIKLTAEDDIKRFRDRLKKQLKKLFLEVFSGHQGQSSKILEEIIQNLFDLNEDGLQEYLEFIFESIQRIGFSQILHEKLVSLIDEYPKFQQKSQQLIKNSFFQFVYALLNDQDIKSQIPETQRNLILDQFKHFQNHATIEQFLTSFQLKQSILKSENQKHLEMEAQILQEKNDRELYQKRKKFSLESFQDEEKQAEEEQKLIQPEKELFFSDQKNQNNQNQFESSAHKQQQFLLKKQTSTENSSILSYISSQLNQYKQIFSIISLMKFINQEDLTVAAKENPNFKPLFLSYQEILIFQPFSKSILEYILDIYDIDEQNTKEIALGYSALNVFNDEILNNLSKRPTFTKEQLMNIISIQIEDLQFYSSQFGQRVNRGIEEDIFIIKKISCIVYFIQCFISKFRSFQQIEQYYQSFLNLITNSIYMSKAKQINSILSCLFLQLFIHDLTNDQILESFELHYKTEIFFDDDVESKKQSYLQFFKDSFPNHWKIFQEKTKSDFNLQTKNFSHSQQSPLQQQILVFLVKNLVKQLDSEFQECSENNKNNTFPCLLDAQVSGKIIASICKVFPQYIPFTMNIKLTQSSPESLILFEQEITFFEYLIKIEPYYEIEELLKINEKIPHFYYLHQQRNQIESSISVAKQIKQSLYKQYILNQIKQGITNDQQLIDLINYLRMYTLYYKDQIQHEQQQNILNVDDLKDNIIFCQHLLEIMAENDFANFDKINSLFQQFKEDYIFGSMLSNLKALRSQIYQLGPDKILFEKRKQYLYYYFYQNFQQFLEQNPSYSEKQNSNQQLQSSQILSSESSQILNLQKLNQSQQIQDLQNKYFFFYQTNSHNSSQTKEDNSLEQYNNENNQNQINQLVITQKMNCLILQNENSQNITHKSLNSLRISKNFSDVSALTDQTIYNQGLEERVFKFVYVPFFKQYDLEKINLDKIFVENFQDLQEERQQQQQQIQQQIQQQKQQVPDIKQEDQQLQIQIQQQPEQQQQQQEQQQSLSQIEENNRKIIQMLQDLQEQKFDSPEKKNNSQQQVLDKQQLIIKEIKQIFEQNLKTQFEQNVKDKNKKLATPWKNIILQRKFLSEEECDLLKKNFEHLDKVHRIDLLKNLSISFVKLFVSSHEEELEIKNYQNQLHKQDQTRKEQDKQFIDPTKNKKNQQGIFDLEDENDEDYDEDDDNECENSQNQIPRPITKIIEPDSYFDPELDKILSKKEFYENCPIISDSALSTLILMAFSQNNKCIIQCLPKLCMRPHTCYMLIDAIIFIMLLEEQDFQILKQQNSPLSKIYQYGENYKKNIQELYKNFVHQKLDHKNSNEALQKDYLAQIILEQFLLEKNHKELESTKDFFQIMQEKWGIYILLHGIFNKYRKIKLLNKDFFDLNDENDSISSYFSLSMIENARQIIKNQNNIDQFNIRQHDHTYQSFLFSVDTRLQTNQNLQKSIDFLKKGKIFIQQLEQEKIAQIKQMININNQNEDYIGDIDTKLKHFYFLDNEHISQSIVISTKKLLFPHFDIQKMFENNEIVFQKFVQIIMTMEDKYVKQIFQEFLIQNPKFLESYLQTLFDEPAKKIQVQFLQLLELTENYTTNYYSENNIAPQQQSLPLLSLPSKEEFRKQAKDLTQFLDSHLIQLEAQSKLIWSGVDLIRSIIKQISNRIIILSNQRTKYQAAIKNIQKVQSKNIQDQEKKELLIQSIEQTFKYKNKLIKQSVKTKFSYIIKQLKNLNEIFELYQQFGLKICQFLGADEDTKDELNGIQVRLTYILSSLTYLGSEFCKDSPKIVSKIPIISEEVEIQQQIGVFNIQKVYQNKEEYQNYIKENIPLVRLQKLYSSSQNTIVQSKNLQDIFDSIFHLSVFYFFNHEKAFFKPQLYKMFKIQTLLRGDTLPFKEKINSLQQISFKRAEKSDRIFSKSEKDKRKKVVVEIDRSSPWMCTYRQLLEKLAPNDLTLCQITIKFKEEKGDDQGGLLNEWLTILVQEIFHPNFGLFQLNQDKTEVQPSPLSFLIPNSLLHFRYIGRLLGKAIIENWKVEVSLTQPFLKHILDKPLLIDDLQHIQKIIYKTYQDSLQNKISDVQWETMCITNSTQLSVFEKFIQVPFKHGSEDELINQSNSLEYFRQFAQFNLCDLIKDQIIAFKQGIHDIIPSQALQMLSAEELGLHLSGRQVLDVDELEKYCKFEQGYTKNDETVKHFFEVVREMDEGMRKNFLYFFTGSFKIEFEGFKRIGLTLMRTVDVNRVPSANTCFSIIMLPDYKNIEALREKLRISILYGGGKFELV